MTQRSTRTGATRRIRRVVSAAPAPANDSSGGSNSNGSGGSGSSNAAAAAPAATPTTAVATAPEEGEEENRGKRNGGAEEGKEEESSRGPKGDGLTLLGRGEVDREAPAGITTDYIVHAHPVTGLAMCILNKADIRANNNKYYVIQLLRTTPGATPEKVLLYT